METSQVIDLRSTVTVNCAGAWAPLLNHSRDLAPRTRITKGVHLVLPALPTDHALIIPTGSDRRVVFMMPWYGRTLLGTTDTDFTADPDTADVDPQDVAYLLAAANRVLAKANWSEKDVISRFVGLRTLPATEDGAPSSVSREWSIERVAEGLLSCVGGKFTSARADASVAVDRVMRHLKRRPGKTPTSDRALPWRPEGRYSTWRRQGLIRGMELGLDEETAGSCLERYGTRVDRLHEMIEELPALAKRIIPDAQFCMAEILFAPREEMARTLEDVLRRRIPMLLVSQLPERTLEWAASMVGSALRWSEERKREEVLRLTGRRGTDR